MMKTKIEQITTPEHFLRWLRKQAAQQARKGRMPETYAVMVEALLDYAAEAAAIKTNPLIVDALRYIAPELMVVRSKAEVAFVKHVLWLVAQPASIFSIPLACFVLGSLLGDLEFWVSEDGNECGMCWNIKRAKRLAVEINVPLDTVTLHLGLDWIESLDKVTWPEERSGSRQHN